jgi:hypothetical protein
VEKEKDLKNVLEIKGKENDSVLNADADQEEGDSYN